MFERITKEYIFFALFLFRRGVVCYALISEKTPTKKCLLFASIFLFLTSETIFFTSRGTACRALTFIFFVNSKQKKT